MKGNSLFPADTGLTDTLVTLFMVEKAVASVSNALAQQSKSVSGTMQRLMRLMQRRR
jgi:maltose alpha-D-glucosyltransferase/alpha-amylase